MVKYYKIKINRVIGNIRNVIIDQVAGQYIAEEELDLVKYIADPYFLLYGNPINIQISDKDQNNDSQISEQKDINTEIRDEIAKIKESLKEWKIS